MLANKSCSVKVACRVRMTYLIWVGAMGVIFTLPMIVFLNYTETVKAVDLGFSSINCVFTGDIHTKFAISNLARSPDIGQNPWMRVHLYACVYLYICKYAFFHLVVIKFKTLKSIFWDFHSNGFVVGFN